MEALAKPEFLKHFGDDFSGNDQDGYIHRGFSFSENDLPKITRQNIKSIAELETMIENHTECSDEFAEFNNLLMSYIFGDGKEFQGSYEEEVGSGDYCWLLDFGTIEIDSEKRRINYNGIRFYKD